MKFDGSSWYTLKKRTRYKVAGIFSTLYSAGGEKLTERVYRSYLRKKSKQLKTKMGKDTVSFLFITDFHGGANAWKSPEIVKYLAENNDLRRIVFGGDFITRSDPDKNKMEKLGRKFYKSFCLENTSFLPVFGNHDDNSYEQKNKEAVFKIEEVERIIPVRIYRDDSLLQFRPFVYAIDSEIDKTRFIVLNTAFQEYIDKQQVEWLNSTLYSTKDGYNIVVVGHCWLEWNAKIKSYKPNEKTTKLFGIFDAYNKREITEFGDYKNCNAEIVMMIGGDIHNDYVTYTDSGIPIILCDADAYKKTCNQYPPISGHPYEQCLSAIVLNKSKREIDLIRIGRGKDRVLNY